MPPKRTAVSKPTAAKKPAAPAKKPAAPAKKPAAAAKKSAAPATTLTAPHELVALRGLGKRGFFGDPEYGEVALLAAGRRPKLAKDKDLPWHLGEWIAEEADGAAIGYLKLTGVGLAEAPIVRITNEGQVEITGLSLIDHFALATDAAGGELTALLACCRAHALPVPRTREAVTAIVKKAKLAKLGDQLPAVDAKAWIAAVAASRPTVPAAAAPAKPAPAATKGGKAVSPLIACAYGCVGPDGAPWLALRDDKKKTRIARFTGDELALVTEHPGGAMSLAAVGGALVTLDHYVTEGGVFADGQWSSYPAPEDGDGALVGDGVAAYFLSRRGTLYRWTGKELRAVPKVGNREDAIPVLDGTGALYLAGGEVNGEKHGDVTRVVGEQITALPRCPEENLFAACIVGRTLVATSSSAILRLPLDGKPAWASTPLPGELISCLVPLTGGQVLLVGNGSAVRTFDPRTGKLADAGRRLLKNGGGTAVVLPTPDGGALWIGGTVGIRSKGDAAMYPQRWRAGAVTALPGLEKATAAQAKDQAKGSMFPWR